MPTPGRRAPKLDDGPSVVEPRVFVEATLADPLEQSRARWGSSAVVSERRIVAGDGREHVVRFVGRLDGPDAWEVLGRGRTWGEALSRADARNGGR